VTDLGAAILDLLAKRRDGATVCPSDVARAVAGPDGPWRKLMEPVRQAGRELAADGKLVVTQRGEQVDPTTARGAIRYRLP
jgi:hypothetical protein